MENGIFNCDEQNNKWIITHDGIWVIKENMTFWPSEEGINVENSSLLSSKVYDVALDLRQNSSTFGKCEKFELSAENKLQLFIRKSNLKYFRNRKVLFLQKK